MELCVIIVNFRTPRLVYECLQSLEANRTDGEFRVVVVDNGSGDDSADRIDRRITDAGWESWVRCVRSEKNLGFSGGNNFGLTYAGNSKNILFLNSDTIVEPGCLSHCLSVLTSNTTIGALSCRLMNVDGSVQNTARRFPSPARLALMAAGLPYRWPRRFSWADVQDPGWDRGSESRPVDWLGGAFLMVPTRVIEEVGGFDDTFFFYGEDVEFCARISRAGYVCWYESAVATIHLGAGSSDELQLPPHKRNLHRIKSRYLEQRKIYGHCAEAFVRTVDTTRDFLVAIRRMTSGKR